DTRSPGSAGRAASTAWSRTCSSSRPTGGMAVAERRVSVRKTYKLYIGGEFPRSESGRAYPAMDADGNVLARAARASRKDVRDAVRAARAAFTGWAGRTAYNRGQILYRVAELMEGRRAQFVAESERSGSSHPEREVDA